MRRYIAVEEAEFWDESEDFNGVDIESAMEEAEVMEEAARVLAAEITADNAEAERAADLSDSLEDLAVVASSIDEATPAETQLIQLAGDMATAGDDEVTSEDIVPATESFVGKRIAVEGFVEKVKQIWEAIKKYLKDLWDKVEKFFYNIFGAIPRVRKQVKALRERLADTQDAGKSLDKDGKKFELSSGLESLKVNEKVATSIGAVLEAFAASVKAGEELFKSKEIAKFGQSIAKAINKYDPETAAAAGEKEDAPRRERKPRPAPRRKEGAERKPRAEKPAAKAPRAPREEQHTPVSDISVLTVGQSLKVKAGNNAMDATVLEITKDGVRVQLNSGMSLIVRAEHLVF